MPVYLIKVNDVEQIHSHEKGNLQYWENNNLNFDEGVWVIESTLEQIKKLGQIPTVLAEHPLLPVFYGNLEAINQTYYNNSLSAICISREEGSKIRGISYLHEYWNASNCFDLHR